MKFIPFGNSTGATHVMHNMHAGRAIPTRGYCFCGVMICFSSFGIPRYQRGRGGILESQRREGWDWMVMVMGVIN